jgi:hypothetical protein
MDEQPFDQREFIESIIDKYGLELKIPPIGEVRRFIALILENFEEGTDGRSLLAMSLSALLIQQCEEIGDHEPMLALADGLLSIYNRQPENDDLEITCQELRSALFWRFVRTNHSDIRLLESESRLMAALCQGSPQAIRRADAALTHGWRGGKS